VRNKQFIIILIGFLSFFSTSCIDIVEELWIKDKNGGQAFFRIEANALGGLINFAGNYIDNEMFNKIVASPNFIAKNLSKIKGVSDIQAVNMLKSGTIGIKFKYKSTKALNRAYYSILNQKKRLYYPSIFKINANRFKKMDLTKYLRNYLTKNKDKFKSDELLQLVNYKSIYHFEKEIEEIKNSAAIKFKSENAVIQNCSANDLLNTEINLGNIIKY